MVQPDLFTYSSISTRELLLCRAREGLLFYGIAQVAKMTGKTPFEVRYAIISTYHLDALRLGGEYRIPYSAVIDYLDYLEYKTGEFIEHDGAYDCDPGRIALERYLLLLPHKKAPMGKRPYDALPGKTESCPLDWYSLDRLPLPLSAAPLTWARILGVSPDLVESEVGGSGTIGWPEIYDWLVACEVINLSVPMEFEYGKNNKETQPGLFG